MTTDTSTGSVCDGGDGEGGGGGGAEEGGDGEGGGGGGGGEGSGEPQALMAATKSPEVVVIGPNRNEYTEGGLGGLFKVN